jgi:hypothetical protein
MGTDPIIHLDPDRNPWERQNRESDKLYARFGVYRDLGDTRTLLPVLDILQATGDTKLRSLDALRKIAYSYRWTERAQAWDVHQASAERQRMVKLRQDMIDRHRKLALGLIGKAASAVQQLAIDEMSPADIVRFLALGTDLERKAIGEPERVAISGPTGGPVQVEDLSRYTPAERQRRLAQIAAELARRAGRAMPVDGDEDD